MANTDGLDTPYADPGIAQPTDPAIQPPGLGLMGQQSQIQEWYQQYLGRPATQEEINAHLQNPGGLSAVEAVIKGSPEAAAYQPPVTPPTPTGAPPPSPSAPPPSAVTPSPTATPPPSAATLPVSAPGPLPTAPDYVTPAPQQARPDFSYEDFKDPTAGDVYSDQGYQFERDQGLAAIGANRAAAGTLNTGGTLKDYVGFADNLARTHYGDVWNRKKAAYDTNRAGAFDAWKANYGVAKDVYDTNYKTQYADPFAFSEQRAGRVQNNNQFTASLGQSGRQFDSTMDFNRWMENYKRSTLDPFDFKYKTLSLL